MDHTESIVKLDKILNIKFIEKIIPFIKHRAVKNLETRFGIIKNIRNVKGYHLNFDSPTNIFYWNYIKQELERVYKFYKIKFPLMTSSMINQIDLLKYSKGGNYKVHTDHFTTAPRHLSIIMNLNNEYKGGDLVFTDQKLNEIKRFKLDKGSVVLFPSNFLYPHTIEPITKGTRYSIVSWLQ
jgi:predicted 2-oxoglutarate/Fe(II)-dependent dioxygenase YbiX